MPPAFGSQLQSLAILVSLILSASRVAGARQSQCPWNPVAFLQAPTPARIVDDTTGNDSGTPWANDPYCLVPRSVGEQEKFCVYSAPSFNEARGLSLITLPEIAASLAAGVQNPTSAGHARRHLAGQHKYRPKEEPELPYVVREVRGKGIGVVAKRDIKQFELVMTGLPAMVVDNDLFPSLEQENPPDVSWSLFEKALEHLTDQQRFLSLARSMPQELHAVDDIIRTNAFGVTINGRRHKVLYPEVAVCTKHPWRFSLLTRT